MTIGMLGRKLGMTHVFSEEGEWVPVTVIEAGSCTVIQRKTKKKDGYNALQLGFMEKKAKKVNRPLSGHFKKHKVPSFCKIKEVRIDYDIEGFESGKVVSVCDVFKVGDYVNISGKTKGRGFSGVIKRWGFRGGPGSHGSMFNRAPGSIGASAFPSRVVKGKKLPGRFGGQRITVKNLKVVAVKPEDNFLMVKGAVPGSTNGIVEIRKASKKVDV